MKIIIIYISIVIIATFSSVYFLKIKPDTQKCLSKNTGEIKNDDFKLFIDSLSEKQNGTWKDTPNKYDIYSNDVAKKINSSPEKYFPDALNIISNKSYDQSQKIYTILLIQHLPIKKYMCLMDIINNEVRSNNIDNEVAKAAILPDLNIRGTTIYYWWLPDWRDRFKENSKKILDKSTIDDVLSGRYSFSNI
ncbi:hypothetical protein V2154_11010 [Ewingella sp. CoE-038-23]|uniref:hypothetical protein n=1 Tax=Ewingella docleensis TaxID=3118588 RepID=UPI0033656ACB